jgi:hypothetical protein
MLELINRAAIGEDGKLGGCKDDSGSPVFSLTAVFRQGVFTPITSGRNREAQFAPKNGQKPKPSRWPAYTSSAHRKGQKPSPAAGYFFSISRPGAPLRGGRHVVNRAHRRTISAAPQEVSLSRRNSNIGCCSGVVRGSRVRSISDHTPLQCHSPRSPQDWRSGDEGRHRSSCIRCFIR